MNKIRHYFSTLELTTGLGIALLSSAFIYLDFFHFSHPLLTTILGLLTLYFLLASSTKTWFIVGAGIGLFWFWWISLSFIHYEMLWAIPIVVIIMALLYAVPFGIIAWVSEKITSRFTFHSELFTLLLKALGLLALSYVHPFGFDWFKPELMFVDSYFGIEKWQFAVILGAIVLSLWRNNILLLMLVVFAYVPTSSATPSLKENIALIGTHITVEDKWNEILHPKHFKDIFAEIDQALAEKKSLIILPESVFPVFLNHDKITLLKLKEKSKNISIVTGALYWDGKTPRNSTYIFNKGKITVANKVLLVPFGESNPLPDFLSDWVNEVFYDGAVDYVASADVTDYTIDGVTYRNAICFEGTSEKLYEKDKAGKRPENMILLSNNGWFTPSIEPTLQKLLLQYYSKKYGTDIYHSVNMSDSYLIKNGKLIYP
ncbi:MAG: apolipoprotein N-acyltransferase [Sulfurovum sp.]|nr:apolipoprotein N-acyltransferase [Sulfurovum sp.]